MKVERDAAGDFLLDPALLAEKFALDAEDLRRRLRLGLVTSKVEAGMGDDEGRQRLTVRCGNLMWRAVVDASRTVVSEEMLDLDQLEVGS